MFADRIMTLDGQQRCHIEFSQEEGTQTGYQPRDGLVAHRRATIQPTDEITRKLKQLHKQKRIGEEVIRDDSAQLNIQLNNKILFQRYINVPAKFTLTAAQIISMSPNFDSFKIFSIKNKNENSLQQNFHFNKGTQLIRVRSPLDYFVVNWC